MKIRSLISILSLIVAIACSPLLHGQATGDFDPRDLRGPWRGYSWHNMEGKPRGPAGLQNFVSFDQKIPEPPLTEWAKQHLLVKSMSNDALAGPHRPGWDRPGHVCPNNQDPCYLTDPNGVPTMDLKGEYPGKDCEPLSTPAIYDYPNLAPMEFVTTPEGDRIFQFIEYHREWRTFWLDRDHPKDIDPSYEGDSTAHWEGNTLVVETIGYNGKTMFTENVGQYKSDAFRLVERFRRIDRDNLILDMTYYDPKAWGDKSWTGFRKYYHLMPKEEFQEFICSPRDYKVYDQGVIAPEAKSMEEMKSK